MLLISEQCFVNLIKKGEEFNKNKPSEFFYPWPDLDEFVDKIFDYL